jgi:hypothetical protein
LIIIILFKNLKEKNMGYIKCPICELNYMLEGQEMCEDCLKKAESKKFATQVHKTNDLVSFGKIFVFVNENKIYGKEKGFLAFDDRKRQVGIVFMTSDKRSPAYEYAELKIYSQYENEYGRYHKIKSNDIRIKYDFLCEVLTSKGRYECFVD